jgi:hypothetical protein
MHWYERVVLYGLLTWFIFDSVIPWAQGIIIGARLTSRGIYPGHRLWESEVLRMSKHRWWKRYYPNEYPETDTEFDAILKDINRPKPTGRK